MLGRWQVAVVFSMALTLAGCASNVLNYPANKIEKLVEVSGGHYDSKITYLGPKMHSTGDRSSVQDVQFARLYAERSKRTDHVEYYVLADVLYAEGWRYYRRASFADSQSVKLKTLWFADTPCSARDCDKSYSVRVPVHLSRLLNQPKLEFRIESITGQTNVFVIPRNHIEGFIQATRNNVRAKRAN